MRTKTKKLRDRRIVSASADGRTINCRSRNAALELASELAKVGVLAWAAIDQVRIIRVGV